LCLGAVGRGYCGRLVVKEDCGDGYDTLLSEATQGQCCVARAPRGWKASLFHYPILISPFTYLSTLYGH
jgi:hypothetical protein